VTMNATVGNQSQEMEAVAPRARESFLRDGIAAKFAFRDRLINSSKILINDPARAQIEMTYFRVPHLSFGKANIETARA
jgi:hypothetical protein